MASEISSKLMCARHACTEALVPIPSVVGRVTQHQQSTSVSVGLVPDQQAVGGTTGPRVEAEGGGAEARLFWFR